jgi:hypothetical protein
MKLSDDFIDRWNHIISDIDEKTMVPLECISKVIVKFPNRRRKTINFKTLAKQGLDLDDIEGLLTKKLDEWGDEVLDLEFILDVQAVANLIQPQTNKLLNGL